MIVHQFPCLSDNYGYLLHDPETGQTAAIDTPDADAYNAELAAKGWRLTHIFNTHWHPDHAGGNGALKDKWDCQIYVPNGELDRIAVYDHGVGEGDVVKLGAFEADILDCPGHTSGHIIYNFASINKAFVGDVLFALGCGRLFEGTPDQMWASLLKLRALPAETVIHCAHEYTMANADFAKTIETNNVALITRISKFEKLRAANKPTVPMKLSDEIATNPFLRADQPQMRDLLTMPNASDVEIFAEIRKRKDQF